MRPLHRPLHPTFIYNTDWVRMSEKEREKAMTEGKFRLNNLEFQINIFQNSCRINCFYHFT